MKITPEIKQEILRLAKYYTVVETAFRIGCSYQRVYLILKEEGIQSRTRIKRKFNNPRRREEFLPLEPAYTYPEGNHTVRVFPAAFAYGYRGAGV